MIHIKCKVTSAGSSLSRGFVLVAVQVIARAASEKVTSADAHLHAFLGLSLVAVRVIARLPF